MSFSIQSGVDDSFAAAAANSLQFCNGIGNFQQTCAAGEQFCAEVCPQTIAEHSWRVALMAMLLSGEAEGVDLNKVLRMCVIHDLGEAITGDIPSFWKTEADAAKEDKEVFALAESLPEPVRSEWKALFAEMIEMKTPEARVYKALDKLEAVLQHNEAPLSTWIPLEYELNQTYGMEEAKASIPFLEAVRNLAVTDTKEKLQKEST